MNMNYTNKEKKILSELNRLLPNIEFGLSRAGTEKAVNSSHYFISPQFTSLFGSEYFYKETPTFIHFSTLFGIEGILTTKNIRLYNINNLTDPREYSFAGNVITIDSKYKKDAKDNLFLLSMCNTDLLQGSTEIEFNMWRLYGDNGKGVAIELSFDKSSLINWVDYFLSSVQYGAESRTKLKELNNLLSRYNAAKPKVSIDLGQIACFHKSRLFGLEKEIRLLYDNRIHRVAGARTYKDQNDNITSPNIKIDITKSTLTDREIKYLELPIYNNKFVPVYDENPIPIPKIERIILGYHYNDNFLKVAKYIESICETNLGYKPKIIKSRLTNYYHDLSSS